MQKDLPSTDSKAAPYGRDLQARKQLNTNDNHSSCNWFFTEKKKKQINRNTGQTIKKTYYIRGLSEIKTGSRPEPCQWAP